MGAIIGVLLAIGVVVGMALLDGLVLSVMWGWFLVPLGLPPIGLAMAIGIGAIVSLVTSTHVHKSRKGEEIDELVESLINAVLKLVILLVVGWIAHKCL